MSFDMTKSHVISAITILPRQGGIDWKLRYKTRRRILNALDPAVACQGADAVRLPRTRNGSACQRVVVKCIRARQLVERCFRNIVAARESETNPTDERTKSLTICPLLA